MSTKITKDSGRSALEEFGRDSGIGDIPPEISQEEEILKGAISTFPNESERTIPDPATKYRTPPPLNDAGVIGAGLLDEFKFLECDPIEIGEQEQKECPVCTPNEYAYVPDYRMMQDGIVFFNGKNCTQNVVLTVPSPTKDGPTATKLANNNKYRREQKERGVRLMLDYFNRSDVATIHYYIKEPPQNFGAGEVAGAVGASGGLIAGAAAGAAIGGFAGMTIGSVLGAATGYFAAGFPGQLLIPDEKPGYIMVAEERDVVKELMQYTKFDFSVPIQLNGRTRILISVPTEYFDRIPVKLEVEPTTDFQTDLEVTIDARERKGSFRRVTHALDVFARQYDTWVTLDGGSLVEQTNAIDGPKKKVHIDLQAEADKLRSFQDSIEELVQEATGLRFSQWKPTKLAEKITFKFEEIEEDKLRIVQITTNKPGCPDILFNNESKEYGTKGIFEKYMEQSPMKQSRTLFYVGALPEMDLALQARTPMPWLEFITKFTYPGLEVYYGENDSSLANDVSMLECFTGSESGPGTLLDDLADLAMNTGLGIPDAILARFNQSTCKTREQKREMWKKISSGEDWADFKEEMECQYKRALSLQKGKVTAQEPFVDMIMGAISEHRAEVKAIKNEYMDVIPGDPNAVGSCGKKPQQAKNYQKGERYKNNKAERKGRIKNETDLWGKIVDKLGWCGWVSLIMDAINCVSQGLAEQDAMDMLVGAAFDAMSDAHFERVLVGLDPETQLAIQALAEKELGYALTVMPWDMGYQGGSYSGPGFNPLSKEEKEAAEIAAQNAAMTEEFARFAEEQQAQEQAVLDQQKEDMEALQADMESGNYTPVTVENEDGTTETYYVPDEDQPATLDDYSAALEGATTTQTIGGDEFSEQYNKQYDEAADVPPPSYLSTEGDPAFGASLSGGSFGFGGQSKGSGGTYGTALGNVQKAVFDAYRNAVLKSVGADVLLESMSKLPGAAILTTFMKRMPCKPPGPLAFTPQLDSFLNTLELGFNVETCKWDKDLTLPRLNCKIPGADCVTFKEAMWNIMTLLAEAVITVIEEAAVALMLQALKLILEKIWNMACDALAMAGANLLDLFGGSDHFKNLLKDNMCPDATDDDLYEALRNILSTLQPPGSSCLERLTNEELGAFIDDLSMMLTQGQILSLMAGEAGQETLTLAVEVAKTSSSECIREIFSDPNAYSSLFPSLGIFIPNLADLRDSIPSGSYNDFTNPCPPDIRDAIEDLKCELLQNKGLTTQECRDQLDDLKDKAMQDLKDLADLLQNGPFGNFPDLEGDDCTPGIYPQTDPIQAAMNSAISGGIFKKIEIQHLRDLMGPLRRNGKGGVLNAVLADTKGRSNTMHNWMVGAFGSPLAADMGVFEWNSDDAITDPDGGDDIDIYGNEIDRGFSFIKIGGGGYPPTVGAWMHKTLKEIKPEFKTKTIPTGYATLQEAQADYERVMLINLERVKNREKYINAFIDEFEMEERSLWPTSFAEAASGMRMAASQQIFLSADNLKEDPGHEGGSSPDDVWKIFNDKDIFVRSLTTGKDTSRWSDQNKKAAGTNGKSFVDYYGKEAALLPLPDTSSADISLHFEDYGDQSDDPKPAYQFDLEYDYNMFDDNGKLRKDNAYVLRVVETIDGTAASAGEVMSRKEMRKTGGAPAAPSIVQDGLITYVRKEVVSETGIEPEVKNLLDVLDVYNDDVEDSFEVESFYRYMSELLIAAADDKEEARSLTEDPSFRFYFSGGETDEEATAYLQEASEVVSFVKPTEVKTKGAFDSISDGFLRRIAFNISTGLPDIAPSNETDSDPEPGFLEPPAAGQTEDDGFWNDMGFGHSSEDAAEKIGLSLISPAFRYGVDPYTEPNVQYLDPSRYGGFWARLAISLGRDPDSVPQPFYVEPPPVGGWYGLSQTLMPEVDGCEPSRKALFSLGDLTEQSAELGGQLERDLRLDYDPLCTTEAPFDKILEPTTAGNIDGVIRSVIRIYATDTFLRAMPAFIMFGLTKDNYDDLLMTMVSDKVREGLHQDGRTGVTILSDGRPSDDYYYQFLEQCVNSVVRKLDSGIIKMEDLTEAENLALKRITLKVREFYDEYEGELEAMSSAAINGQNIMKKWLSASSAPAVGLGTGSGKFSKWQANAAKKVAFEETIQEMEAEAIVFLKRYIREEFEAVQEMFRSQIPSYVENVHHLFLLSDGWVNGGAKDSGPFDVQSNPNNPLDYNISVGISSTYQAGLDALESNFGNFSQAAKFAETMLDLNKDWPFVLEKYILVEDKTNIPNEVLSRANNLHDIININDWKNYVQSLKASGIEGDISDFWGNASLSGETTKIEEHTHNYEIDEDGNGVTSIHIDEATGTEHFHIIENHELQRAEISIDDNGHRHEINITGWKFGLRLCYLVEQGQKGKFDKVMRTIGQEEVLNKKAYTVNSPAGERYLIPIASAVLPIPDQDYTKFDPNSYDVYCLITELIKTVEYRTWFTHMFPISRFISIIATYIGQGFFASLGNSGYPKDGGDMWEKRKGNRGVFGRFRKWSHDDSDIYSYSRREARAAFGSLYTQDANIDYESGFDPNPDAATTFRELLSPKVNFEDGLRWWQRGRRVSRPFNMDGEECDD